MPKRLAMLVCLLPLLPGCAGDSAPDKPTVIERTAAEEQAIQDDLKVQQEMMKAHQQAAPR